MNQQLTLHLLKLTTYQKNVITRLIHHSQARKFQKNILN
jgi:hypothetical protein